MPCSECRTLRSACWIPSAILCLQGQRMTASMPQAWGRCWLRPSRQITLSSRSAVVSLRYLIPTLHYFFFSLSSPPPLFFFRIKSVLFSSPPVYVDWEYNRTSLYMYQATIFVRTSPLTPHLLYAGSCQPYQLNYWNFEKYSLNFFAILALSPYPLN